MKGSGGQNNRNKSEGDRSQNNLVNRSQQTHVPNHGNRALDHRRDSQNQLGKPNQQKQQHTQYSKLSFRQIRRNGPSLIDGLNLEINISLIV